MSWRFKKKSATAKTASAASEIQSPARVRSTSSGTSSARSAARAPGRRDLVRPDRVDLRALPRCEIERRPEEAVDPEMRIGGDAEAEAADVRLADHDLRPRTAVVRRDRLAVHAEERAGVDGDGRPRLVGGR